MPLSHIKLLPEKLHNRRRLVISVSLKGIQEQYERHEMDRMFKHLEALMDNRTELKLCGDNAYINGGDAVELFELFSAAGRTDQNQNQNQKYVRASLSERFNGMMPKRYWIEDLASKVVLNAKNIEFIVVAPERIFKNVVKCILKEDADRFMDGERAVQAFGLTAKTAPVYEPKKKELCLVEIEEAASAL